MRVFSDWYQILGKCKIIMVKSGDRYINKRLARVFVGLRCEGIPNITWKGVGESLFWYLEVPSRYIQEVGVLLSFETPTVTTHVCCEVHVTNPDMDRTYPSTKYVDFGLRLGNSQATVDLSFLL